MAWHPGCKTLMRRQLVTASIRLAAITGVLLMEGGSAAMDHPKRFLKPLVCVVVGLVSVSAQSSRTFKTRLSPVPIDVSMQANIAGSGSVTAVLNGTKLSITGTFEGLKSPATIA